MMSIDGEALPTIRYLRTILNQFIHIVTQNISTHTHTHTHTHIHRWIQEHTDTAEMPELQTRGTIFRIGGLNGPKLK